MKRFITVLAAVGVVAAIFAGAASALAFADEDYVWPDGEVGTLYSKQLIGRTDFAPCYGRKDRACRYSLIDGSFPPGITMTSDGLVSGIPQKLGVYDFWLQLSSIYGGSAQREFSIDVNSVKLTASIDQQYLLRGNVLKDAFKGAAYSATFSASGGSGAGTYTWSLLNGALPAGMTLGANGVLTGTPTATGTAEFTVQVKDRNGKTDTKHVYLQVFDPLGVTISTRVAEVGRPFTATLQGSGGASGYKYATVTGLPAGVTFDGVQTIQGTPTTRGAAHLTVVVTDADGNPATLPVVVKVVRRLALSTTHLIGASAGHAYSARLHTSGGVRPFSWRLSGGRLPGGVRLNTSTGALAGHARAAGTFHFRVTVMDALGATSTRALTISVG